MSQADWLQIALISVEIVLGALAIIIGVVAIFGYNWINKQVKETAQKTAQETMNKFLEESNVKEMLENRVRTEGDKLFQEITQSLGHDLNELEKRRKQ